MDLGYSESTKAVVLDVDGTLYSQACLRAKVALDLLGYYARSLHRVGDVWVISCFRKIREEHPFPDTEEDFETYHYRLVAEACGRSVEDVRNVIENWIYKRPLGFLRSCMYVGLEDFLVWLRDHEIQIAVLSDYPADDKLAALGIEADVVISAHDEDVRRLKPDTSGLIKVIEHLGCKASECVYIGDREDRDGLCAGALNMPFVLVRKSTFDGVSSGFYTALKNSWEIRTS